MSTPLRIPLSSHQVARLASFQRDADAIHARLNDTVTAIVAGSVDPGTLKGWEIRQDGDAILCTPPQPTNTGPSGDLSATPMG